MSAKKHPRDTILRNNSKGQMVSRADLELIHFGSNLTAITFIGRYSSLRRGASRQFCNAFHASHCFSPTSDYCCTFTMTLTRLKDSFTSSQKAIAVAFAIGGFPQVHAGSPVNGITGAGISSPPSFDHICTSAGLGQKRRRKKGNKKNRWAI